MSDNVFEGMEELIEKLRMIRLNSTKEEWDAIIKSILLLHPIKDILFEDPITKRCFNKPRGYSGDAVLLDMIYQYKSITLDSISEIGRKIYEYTSNAPACKAVRYRKEYNAKMIDEIVKIKNRPNVLSVACGHIREIEVSNAAKNGLLSSYVGIDHDPKSIQVVKRDYRRYKVTALNYSVRDILTGKYILKNFDLIYVTGLYDYLTDKIAEKLTSHLFNSLSEGGVLLIANFLPDIQDVGYMESYMRWFLIYRDKPAILKLMQDIPKSRINRFEIFTQEQENIIFLKVYKT